MLARPLNYCEPHELFSLVLLSWRQRTNLVIVKARVSKAMVLIIFSGLPHTWAPNKCEEGENLDIYPYLRWFSNPLTPNMLI